MKTFAIGTVLGALVYAQVTTPVVVHQGAPIDWDVTGLDIQGNPEAIDHHDLGVFPAGADPATSTPVRISQHATNKVPDATTVFVGLPPAEYRLFARTVDVAGNKSGWSNSLDLISDQIPPAIPTNLRITVTVNVNVGTGGTP